MRVVLDAERAHQAIFEDEDFQFVVERASQGKAMLQFVGAAIRRYDGLQDVVHGKAGGDQNMEAYANSYLRDGRSRSTGVDLARRFARLYERFDAGNVRGCLIEAMVEARLRVRYAGTQLENNVFVEVTNGVRYRTSTSADVVGHDGQRGECHDCKARARNVEMPWIVELVTELTPHEFRIGVATADSAPAASHEMSSTARMPHAVVVTGPESWWDGLPLWSV
jgi:hypothetical protein